MKKSSRLKKKTSAKRPKRLAVLCSGGDAPGMNAALRAVVRTSLSHGVPILGIRRGFTGLLEGDYEDMSLRSVANIIQRGGTILKTARCPEFFEASARKEAFHWLQRQEVEGLVVIGGDGSYRGSQCLYKEHGLSVIGLPGTIDNDIPETDFTIGFDTAVNTALEAIDKIRDTASSHDRIFCVEVMGRHSLEIAYRVAVAGGAECIYRDDNDWKSLVSNLQQSIQRGKMSSIVVVPEANHAGRSYDLVHRLKKEVNLEARAVILGHIQRGGSPSAWDRYLASLMGVFGVRQLIEAAPNSAIEGAVSWLHGSLDLISFKQVLANKKPGLPSDAMDVLRWLAN